jgi:hypothetical protein
MPSFGLENPKVPPTGAAALGNPARRLSCLLRAPAARNSVRTPDGAMDNCRSRASGDEDTLAELAIGRGLRVRHPTGCRITLSALGNGNAGVLVLRVIQMIQTQVSVLPGLVPGIHGLAPSVPRFVDGRIKSDQFPP